MKPRAVVRPLEVEPGRRVLVISDIHGNLPLLKGVLKKADFTADDTLVVLGDMVERSAGSLETLRYIMDMAQDYDLRVVRGNCDDIAPRFVDSTIPDAFYQSFLSRWGEKSLLCQMAAEAGIPLEGPADYPAARKTIGKTFVRELDFLRALPHILVNDRYILVHGGVPREDRLDRLPAYDCMKNDNFLRQGRVFRRWVVVGHWPVTLYNERIPSAAPIIDRESRIVSIDGGCTLKWDGQLNALQLPRDPEEGFTWVSEDGFPTVEALDPQEAGPNSLNIRFGHSGLELLEEGEEFCLCRHLETGREMEVLTEYIYRRGDGVYCEDSTDYLLPVAPGDRLHLVRETSKGILAKKDSVTGWYRGRYKRPEG